MHVGSRRAGAAGASAARPPAGALQHTRSRYDSDLEDDFVEEDDEEEGDATEDWRSELQKITGYNPAKYAPASGLCSDYNSKIEAWYASITCLDPGWTVRLIARTHSGYNPSWIQHFYAFYDRPYWLPCCVH